MEQRKPIPQYTAEFREREEVRPQRVGQHTELLDDRSLGIDSCEARSFETVGLINPLEREQAVQLDDLMTQPASQTWRVDEILEKPRGAPHRRLAAEEGRGRNKCLGVAEKKARKRGLRRT